VDLVLVDNGSTDGSAAWARRTALPFPVRVVENAGNESFAAANNAAARDARGELVLFLNNDIIPIDPGWLGYLVESLGRTGAAAAGARLVLPRRGGSPASLPAGFGDLHLQHAGVTFRWIGGIPRPRNVGAVDPADPAWAGVREVPAATAACLLVRRDRFLGLGGFDEAYVYGYEDVDFCLRLGADGGRIVVDGRAVLWHDESATRRTETDRETRRQQRRNLERFNGTWGPRLTRAGLREAMGGERWLTSDAPRLAILGGRDDPALARLADGLASRGWDVARHAADPEALGRGEPDDAIVALVADPALDVRRLPRCAVIAGWIAGDAEAWTASPWFDDLDLVLCAGPDDAVAAAARGATATHVIGQPEGDALLASLDAWTEADRVTILVQARDLHEATVSGDFHFARALRRQLERRGVPTAVRIHDAWRLPISTRDDTVLQLWGRSELLPRPGQRRVLWVMYHPELVTDEVVARYTLVLVASAPFAAGLASRSPVPVHVLNQATDPDRFRPGLPGPAHELLFVGNSRGARRPILDDLVGTPHDLAVYGRGWDPELLDPACWRGDHVANEALAGYYGSAAIVLNDHWRESADNGFINNRIYDALAAGAFVVSDRVDGIEAEFDGGVVTYRDAPDLIRLVDAWLADPAGRAARAARGRDAVLARHTFAHRADALLDLLDLPRSHAGEPAIARPGGPATAMADSEGNAIRVSGLDAV
jgi:GT2 family glycosyltransferase